MNALSDGAINGVARTLDTTCRTELSAPPFAPPFAPFESGLVFAAALVFAVFAVFAVSALVFALLQLSALSVSGS